MPQLFGAPLGLMAAEDQANKTALSQVQAQKLLSEMEQEPTNTALKQAQARHLNADSGRMEGAQADLEALANWEAAARRANAVVPATKGREATVDDVELFKTGSNADPLQKLYDTMVGGGAPSRLTAPLAEKIAKITQAEATGAYRNGQATVQQLEARKRISAEIGSYAAAAMASPEGYAQMRMYVTEAGGNLPPNVKKILDNLPMDWQAGRRALEPIRRQALSVKDAADIALKEEAARQKKLLDASTIARNQASAGAASVRAGLVREQTALLHKLGGKDTPEGVAQKEASTALIYEKQLTERIKNHPKMPANPSNVRAGQSYTLLDSSVGTPVFDTNGKLMGFNEILPALPKRTAPRSAEQIRKALSMTGVDVPENDEED